MLDVKVAGQGSPSLRDWRAREASVRIAELLATDLLREGGKIP